MGQKSSKSIQRTISFLDAMTSGLALNQAAGCGGHGAYKERKRERISHRREAKSVMRRKWSDGE